MYGAPLALYFFAEAYFHFSDGFVCVCLKELESSQEGNFHFLYVPYGIASVKLHTHTHIFICQKKDCRFHAQNSSVYFFARKNSRTYTLPTIKSIRYAKYVCVRVCVNKLNMSKGNYIYICGIK